MSLFSKNFKHRFNLGFTLTELVVTVSITMVILTVILVNQSTYTDQASVANMTDEISITLSEAQAYGIGVRELTPGSDDFSASFGLAFSNLDEEASQGYIFYADRNGNDTYDNSWSCPDTGECGEYVSKRTMNNGVSIGSICIVRNNDTEMCNTTRVDVTFVRPSTGARIIFYNTGGNLFSPQPDNVKGVRITLVSPRGAERNVWVYNTGQISVQ